jgi:hypothetical protein
MHKKQKQKQDDKISTNPRSCHIRRREWAWDTGCSKSIRLTFTLGLSQEIRIALTHSPKRPTKEGE